MNTYLLSYDLIRPHKDYADLHEHLRSYTDWAKPLQSVWLIKSSLVAEEVRDAAQAHMDNDDKILVVDITGQAAAWDNIPTDISTWIENNL